MNGTGTPLARLNTYNFDSLPLLGTTAAGQEIRLGGFSGLWFEGFSAGDGLLRFITHTDRGPNPDPVDLNRDGIPERPFALPDFQPRLVRFELDLTKGVATITSQTLLRRGDGAPISGLPNYTGQAGFAYSDELPIDLFGASLRGDRYGADLESIAQVDDGTFWMGDEYRPALYHFDAGGVLIERYVPLGSNRDGEQAGVEAIPAVYAQRRINRGFEAVAHDNGMIYAFLQSPLDNPDRAGDENSKASRLARILVFNTQTATSVAEYLYELDGRGVDKICDAAALGKGEFLVIESDDAIGPQAQKFIYRIDLTNATNLLVREDCALAWEGQNGHDLAKAGIVPAKKQLYVDLSAIGYIQHAKVEGLALINAQTLAIINDNDFDMSGLFDASTGLMQPSKPPDVPTLGIIHLSPAL